MSISVANQTLRGIPKKDTSPPQSNKCTAYNSIYCSEPVPNRSMQNPRYETPVLSTLSGEHMDINYPAFQT